MKFQLTRETRENFEVEAESLSDAVELIEKGDETPGIVLCSFLCSIIQYGEPCWNYSFPVSLRWLSTHPFLKEPDSLATPPDPAPQQSS